MFSSMPSETLFRSTLATDSVQASLVDGQRLFGEDVDLSFGGFDDGFCAFAVVVRDGDNIQFFVVEHRTPVVYCFALGRRLCFLPSLDQYATISTSGKRFSGAVISPVWPSKPRMPTRIFLGRRTRSVSAAARLHQSCGRKQDGPAR